MYERCDIRGQCLRGVTLGVVYERCDIRGWCLRVVTLGGGV